MHAAVASFAQRKVALAVEHLAGGLDPVVVKRCLKLRDHGLVHAEMHVAPVLGIFGISAPLLRNTDTAGERGLAIDDQ